MATLSYDREGPGAGGLREVRAYGARPVKILTGTFAFDSSYPTGGEDISDIWAQFSELKGIVLGRGALVSAGTGKHAVVDYTTKKLMLYTNAATPAEVADASDQSGATGIHWMAWGV